jgi:hypothetical protein
MNHDKVFGICLIYSHVMYKINEKIKLLLYKIRRSKEEKNLMDKYVKKIKGMKRR